MTIGESRPYGEAVTDVTATDPVALEGEAYYQHLDLGRDTSGHIAFGHGIRWRPVSLMNGLESLPVLLR